MRDLVRAFLAFIRLNRNASPHTVRAYESDLDQFLTFLAGHCQRPRAELQPADITRVAIRGFLAERFRQGESRATAARNLAALRTFLRYLRREGHVEHDPGLLVATPRREQKIPVHLEVGEMTRLLEMPDVSRPLGRRDRAILELLYASGLRLGELVGLDLEDVNLGARMVRVMGKGRKERLVPFNLSAQEALRAWLPDREQLRRDAERRASALAMPAKGKAGARGPRRAAPAAEPLFLNYRGTRLSSRHVHGWSALRRRVQHPVRHQPARDPPLVRHAPARGGGRPAGDPGTARPRATEHHAALHARQRGAVDRRLPPRPPEGGNQGALESGSNGATDHSSICQVVLVTLPPDVPGPRQFSAAGT